ncbi:MMPL family transporter [Rathayibacter sp. KR2-224]|uniref:MMPL family transporter n=1 Tax=Rathayibacter sp. KR2-224 TaxID=3400913 RepID=UPI003BFE29AA
MSSFLYGVGRWAFRARALVLSVWLVLIALAIAGAALLGTGTQNTYAIPGTESQQALDALARTFPQVSGASAQLIAAAPKGDTVRDPAFQSAVEQSVTRLSRLPQVTSATSPYSSSSSANISSDASAVIVPVQLAVAQSAVLPSTADALQAEAHHLQNQLPKGSQTSMGGQLFAQSPAGISVTELLGIAVAFVVLAFTFVSLLAAAMPLVTALLGVGVALSIILAMTSVTTITSTTPLLALMLGLAVGIDYALFITSRHQDQVRSGIDPEESAARAIATAGSAVVFAAVTVMIALLGLSVAGIPFLTTMGVASAGAVALAVLVSMTLTPALLGFVGWRIVRRKYRPGAVRPAVTKSAEHPAVEESAVETDASLHQAVGVASDEDAPPHDAAPSDTDKAAPEPNPSPPDAPPPDQTAPPHHRGFFFGWVRAATKWPIVTVVLVIAALGALSVPAAHLRLALPDAGSLPAGEPGRVTYDLVAEHFGPGYNGPLIVTGSIIQSKDPVGLMNDLGASIAKVPGVVAVPLSTPNQAGDTGIVQVIPNGSPDSEATQNLVARLRGMHDEFQKEYGVDLSVTGYTAAGIDVSARLAQALLPFGILVVGLSLVLLAMVFRSVVVPVTAALGYLLSIGAAFGVTSLVFENGMLAGPLGVASLGSVISFMPIILMGVLFGLAMDYEVFLVSRMREDYVHHGDAHQAIREGFLGSARVVTAAAIIMFAVFAAFVPEGDASIQPIALGLAVGVAIDAFIVRMTLIPAVLTLFGRHAWWMPRGVERVLPRFDAEGEGIALELSLAGWPEGEPMAIAAEGVTLTRGGLDLVEGVDVLVPRGGVLLVRSSDREASAAFVAAVCGRYPLASGTLKVAGLVLPTRTAAVRRLSCLIRTGGSDSPARDVRRALASGVEVIGLCDLDTLGDAHERAAVADELTAGREAAGGLGSGTDVRGRTVTLVASCAPDADVWDIVGPAETYEVAVGGQVLAPAIEPIAAGVE